jgi:methionyl-tRNA formyltransferase
LKTIFFGSSGYVIPIIKELKKNFGLSLVITTEKTDGAVPYFCGQNNIQFLSASSFKDERTKNSIINIKAPIAVVADFGLIIPEDILNSFPKGIINIHPSLLPKFRGPTPVQTAILNGDKITGVSIMKLDKEVDHGPLLGQEEDRILNTDTSRSLYKRLFDKGSLLLVKLLNLYLREDLRLTTQKHEKATFSKTLKREDGFIDISNPPSKEVIQRMIRAYFPWPGVWFKAPLRQGSVGQAKINNVEKIIKLLPGQRIQVEGKKPMTYKDFLNGYSEAQELLSKITC